MAKTYDPHMHTAEHVLNQTMVRTFGCGRCFSSHLNPKKSKCDYFFDRGLTEDEARNLAAAVNTVLARGLPVSVHMTPFAEAAALADLSKLPEAAAAEHVRLVRVGDYDICPCIGDHVENTNEIGTFVLVSHSYAPPEAPGERGVLRLRFVLR